MKPGSLSSTGSALEQPFSSTLPIRNLQSLPYMFLGVRKGSADQKYNIAQTRKFCYNHPCKYLCVKIDF